MFLQPYNGNCRTCFLAWRWSHMQRWSHTQLWLSDCFSFSFFFHCSKSLSVVILIVSTAPSILFLSLYNWQLMSHDCWQNSLWSLRLHTRSSRVYVCIQGPINKASRASDHSDQALRWHWVLECWFASLPTLPICLNWDNCIKMQNTQCMTESGRLEGLSLK